jgi:hypothetical protein
MNANIERIKHFRLHLLKQLKELTTVQLNTIPAGYNNNIIWNLGHLISTAQNMGYVRAGLPITVDDNYVSSYLPGTQPNQFIDEPEVETIKALLITSIDRFQSDFDGNTFVQYTPSVMIPKVYGFEVNTIDEAIDYLLYHEGYHSGYIAAMKRLL